MKTTSPTSHPFTGVRPAADWKKTRHYIAYHNGKRVGEPHGTAGNALQALNEYIHLVEDISLDQWNLQKR